MDAQAARAAALAAAAWNCGPAADPAGVLAAARQFLPFILAATVRLAPAATVDGHPVTPTIPPGGTVPTVNATVDNTTVTLKVQPEDDHGDPTPDQLTWTNDDTAGVVADWVLSADTHTMTGTLKHVEGTANLSVSDPSASGVAALDYQVVVGPAATSQLVGTATVT